MKKFPPSFAYAELEFHEYTIGFENSYFEGGLPGERMKWLKNRIFEAAIIVFMIFVLLGVGEGIASFVLSSMRPILTTADISLEDIAHSAAYENEPWVDDYLADQKRQTPANGHYEPYVLWQNEQYSSTYRNYDENGYRVVLNPTKKSYLTEFNIYMFGASTLAGAGILRDEDLIPTVVSRTLNGHYEDIQVTVHNFGQGGYNQDQEIVQFLQILKTYPIPNLVIFYDGGGELWQKVIFGRPHGAYNGFRRIFDDQHLPFLVKLKNSLIARSSLAQWLFDEEPYHPFRGVIRDKLVLEENAKGMVADVERNYRYLSMLSEKLGFELMVIWYPMLASTGKPLSVEERALVAKITENFEESLYASWYSHELIAASVSAGWLGNAFYDMTNALDEVPDSIMLDSSHMSAQGLRIMGQKISDKVIQAGFLD